MTINGCVTEAELKLEAKFEIEAELEIEVNLGSELWELEAWSLLIVDWEKYVHSEAVLLIIIITSDVTVDVTRILVLFPFCFVHLLVQL